MKDEGKEVRNRPSGPCILGLWENFEKIMSAFNRSIHSTVIVSNAHDCPFAIVIARSFLSTPYSAGRSWDESIQCLHAEGLRKFVAFISQIYCRADKFRKTQRHESSFSHSTSTCHLRTDFGDSCLRLDCCFLFPIGTGTHQEQRTDHLHRLKIYAIAILAGYPAKSECRRTRALYEGDQRRMGEAESEWKCV